MQHDQNPSAPKCPVCEGLMNSGGNPEDGMFYCRSCLMENTVGDPGELDEVFGGPSESRGSN